MLTRRQQLSKRLLDLIFSFVGVIVLGIPILVITVIASISTLKFGLFSQKRVGQYARLFYMYKIRTMKNNDDLSHITVKDDPRITRFGKFLRAFKLDELPQLFNVFFGDMSFVGPRPDVAGYADQLKGKDRIILSIKPGITGPATLKYRDEEKLLAKQENPQEYNDNIIWREKVRINKEYIQDWSLLKDVHYIIKTIFN